MRTSAMVACTLALLGWGGDDGGPGVEPPADGGVADPDAGEADSVVVGVAAQTAPFFVLLEAADGWQPHPLDVEVSAGSGQCVGSGWARDAAAPALVVASVHCTEPSATPGVDVKTSHLLVSHDGGASFAPLGPTHPVRKLRIANTFRAQPRVS